MGTARRYDARVHKAQKEMVEGIQFDSQFEASVYRHIRMVYPREYVACHAPIPVLPETKHFPQLNWRCDFALALPWRKVPLFIEAKGVNTREFKLTLQALAVTNPDILENLLVVHNEIGVHIGRTIQTVNIHILYQLLQRFKAH